MIASVWKGGWVSERDSRGKAPCISMLIAPRHPHRLPSPSPVACLLTPPSPGSPQIGAQPTSEAWFLDGKVAKVGGVAVVVKALGRPEARANLKKLWLG